MHKQPDLQFDAPILPDEGLGGLKLRTHILELQDFLFSMHVKNLGEPGWCQLIGPFEALYRLGAVAVAVDVRNGKVFKLIAHEGYQGRLFGQLAVGMKVRDAMTLDPRLFYDEAEEHILVRGCTGVALDVAEIDPDPSIVPTYPIFSIAVYAEEILTKQGQDGYW